MAQVDVRAIFKWEAVPVRLRNILFVARNAARRNWDGIGETEVFPHSRGCAARVVERELPLPDYAGPKLKAVRGCRARRKRRGVAPGYG
jgi:hypothetical protein